MSKPSTPYMELSVLPGYLRKGDRFNGFIVACTPTCNPSGTSYHVKFEDDNITACLVAGHRHKIQRPISVDKPMLPQGKVIYVVNGERTRGEPATWSVVFYDTQKEAQDYCGALNRLQGVLARQWFAMSEKLRHSSGFWEMQPNIFDVNPMSGCDHTTEYSVDVIPQGLGNWNPKSEIA